MDREIVTNLQQHKEEEEEESDQEQEDAISLCDLSTDHYQEDSDNYDNGGNLEEDNFEFSFSDPSIVTNQNGAGLVNCDDSDINAINFCGKIIGYNNNNNNNSSNNNKAKNDKQQGEAVDTTRVENQTRRLKKSASSQSQQATGSYRCRSSSKSNSSRYKHKVLIGLAKIPTEMDLSDIKKRQSKMRKPTTTTTTSPVPQVTAASVELAASGGENGSAVGGGGSGSERRRNNNRWSLIRSLTCGTRFANVFAKTAFGCFSFSVLRVAD